MKAKTNTKNPTKPPNACANVGSSTSWESPPRLEAASAVPAGRLVPGATAGESGPHGRHKVIRRARTEAPLSRVFQHGWRTPPRFKLEK